MPQLSVTLVRNDRLAPGYHRLVLGTAGPLGAARAGQFVMVRGEWGPDPLLARPMSLLAVDPAREQAELLIKVTGRGTQLLARSQPGDPMLVLGPLGRPFPPAPAVSGGPAELWCVAGGVGVVPVYMLAGERGPAGVRFYYGARDARELLLLDELRGRVEQLRLATDDGSRGEQGRITELVARDLKARPPSAPPVVLAGCGPQPMLHALVRVARAAGGRVISTQLALEAPMACGYGVCLGCNIPRAPSAAGAPAGVGAYLYVCKDGPVFEAKDVCYGAES